MKKAYLEANPISRAVENEISGEALCDKLQSKGHPSMPSSTLSASPMRPSGTTLKAPLCAANATGRLRFVCHEAA